MLSARLISPQVSSYAISLCPTSTTSTSYPTSSGRRLLLTRRAHAGGYALDALPQQFAQTGIVFCRGEFMQQFDLYQIERIDIGIALADGTL